MRDTIIGLDFGSSAIKIIVAEKREGNSLQILSATQKPSCGVRHGYIVDQDAASQSIREAIKDAERLSNTALRHAFISIDGIKLEAQKVKGMVIVSRADNEIADYDVKRVINQSESNLARIVNRRIIHTIPLGFKIEGEIILGRPEGMKGEKLEVETLFITVLNQHLSDLIKSVEAAGLAVDDIVAGPLAASYAFLNKRQKDVGVILVDIGAETTSIIIFEEGIPISLEVFAFGSTHITNDIALGLQIPLEDAEDLKLHYVSDAQKKKLTDIIEARLDDIFELIETHLKKIGRSGLLPAGVVLVGGGANLLNIEELAKRSLKLPAKLGIPYDLKSHDKQIINPKWATALGLCFYGAELERPFRRRYSFLRWLKSFLP